MFLLCLGFKYLHILLYHTLSAIKAWYIKWYSTKKHGNFYKDSMNLRFRGKKIMCHIYRVNYWSVLVVKWILRCTDHKVLETSYAPSQQIKDIIRYAIPVISMRMVINAMTYIDVLENSVLSTLWHHFEDSRLCCSSITIILCTKQNPHDLVWSWLANTEPEHLWDELECWLRHQTSVPDALHFVN